MTFPARKAAIVIWLVAAAFFVLQQIQHPIFERDMLESAAIVPTVLQRLSSAFMIPGVIAGLGAIVQLLGEIRDATPRRKDLGP